MEYIPDRQPLQSSGIEYTRQAGISLQAWNTWQAAITVFKHGIYTWQAAITVFKHRLYQTGRHYSLQVWNIPDRHYSLQAQNIPDRHYSLQACNIPDRHYSLQAQNIPDRHYSLQARIILNKQTGITVFRHGLYWTNRQLQALQSSGTDYTEQTDSHRHYSLQVWNNTEYTGQNCRHYRLQVWNIPDRQADRHYSLQVWNIYTRQTGITVFRYGIYIPDRQALVFRQGIYWTDSRHESDTEISGGMEDGEAPIRSRDKALSSANKSVCQDKAILIFPLEKSFYLYDNHYTI